ncbi:hypothetical protein BH18ACT5_BH18ACT5_19060 [soil metagenome]
MVRQLLFRILLGLSVAWLIVAVWTVLGRSRPFGIEVIDDLGQPVPQAIISSGNFVLGTTGLSGAAEVAWPRGIDRPNISASGFRTLNMNLDGPPTE